MGLPAERIEEQTATEQVIEFDGPDLTEDGYTDDVVRHDEAERLGRTLDQ